MKAKFCTVTITGADDAVDPDDLARLSAQYEFVEWGILCSKKRAGEPRYPTTRWMGRLVAKAGRSALHLCGEFSRRLLSGESFHELHHENLPVYSERCVRLQLNGFSDYVLPGLRTATQQGGGMMRDKTFVLQCSNKDALLRGSVLAKQHPNVVLLWDPSGGREVGLTELPIGLNNVMGYAGGIGPDNVERTLRTLCDQHELGPFWIDMESAVRTDDKLDIDKVKTVLSICVPFYTRGRADN